MNLLQRIAAAVTIAVGTATAGSAYVMPEKVEAIAIRAGMAVMTPELEGTHFKAYPDTGGIWTICTGHTGGIRKGDKATPAECAAYFEADSADVVAFMGKRSKVGSVSLLCKVAMGDFGFNAGTGALGRSKLMALANAGDQKAVANEFLRWRYVGGKDCALKASNCAGIMVRRTLQHDLCMVGL